LLCIITRNKHFQTLNVDDFVRRAYGEIVL
jgi:hypothetical protein